MTYLMELQLGLALPTHDPTSLQLGPFPNLLHSRGSIPTDTQKKKRSFGNAFCDHEEIGEEDVPRTLPLLLWDNQQPNEEDDRNNRELDRCSFVSNKIGGGEGIVGWPPIKLRRRKLMNYHQQHENNGECADFAPGRQLPPVANANSKYVKVKMEGVTIARKIDLSLHHSFSTLKETLFAMFGICQENFGCHELTYQDREGDWLLAEDHVTWRSFVGSAQRLKLMKKSNGQ